MNYLLRVFIRYYMLFGLLLLNSCTYSQLYNLRNFEVLNYDHCQLNITHYSGSTLSLLYETLPGNQAGINHNSLWLWRSSIVPWGFLPMAKQVLPAGYTQSGSYVLNGLTLTRTQYITCYSLDSTEKEICACAVLDAATDSITNEWVNIELLETSLNSLTFKYSTLVGYQPAKYNNWFGVWKGRASPYNPFPPMAKGKPLDDAESNVIGINGAFFEQGQIYTLIYFMGPKLTSAAAIITFKIK